MIRLSIPLRQALSRLTLPVLIAMAFGTMILGKADTVVVDRARMALTDALAPLYGVLAQPAQAMRNLLTDAQGLMDIRNENARLRDENERLRRWQAAALGLEAENAMLRKQLAFIPDIAGSYRTVRVVADSGGVYARAVLLAAGTAQGISKGQVALDDRGLVGRVTEVGDRSARVLLLTDLNSRIPVALLDSRTRAIMAGTNGANPRLEHWPEGSRPQEGERVVTSAEAGAFPAGLPVGVVHYGANGAPEVILYARLDRLDLVRLFDYGLSGILPPEAVARPEPRAKH